jgi:uncharacterized membrane-anchored protein YitT (DUF2179 family)
MAKQWDWKKISHDTFVDIVAGVFIGLGIYNFASAAGFPLAGVQGIALIIYRLTGFPLGLATILLNIPIIVVCYKTLGKGILFRTARTMIFMSLFIDYIAPLLPIYEGDRMLAAICTGALLGIGQALIFMNGSSGGGVDLITLTVRAKKPHLSIGRITWICNIIVILLGAWIFGDIDGTIYAFLISFLLTSIIDKFMYGMDAGKVTLIVTENGPEVAERINEIVGRGSTIIKGRGSYSGIDKDVVLCACTSKQMYQIRKLVKKVDPESFAVIMESSEVVGLGFKAD